ncbi:MAG: DUF3487 family protein [Chromatiales bacterium]|nr:DUF3487 family protein [Chromatiales bacterium]
MKPADFLDDEPLMLKGCTGSELTFVIIASAIFWLFLSVVVSLTLWNIFVGLILFMITVPITVWLITVWYSHLKNSRPRRWHLQYLAHRLHWTGYFHQCQHIGSFRAHKF